MTARRPDAISIAALTGAIVVATFGGCTSTTGPRAGERPGMRHDQVIVQAEAAIDQGDREQAIRLLAAAIEANPEFTPAYTRLGELQFQGGDYAGAERTYASLVELEPRVFDHQYFHGLALHHLGRLSSAIRAYLRALAIDSMSFDAHLNLASAYLQLEEHAQALPYARRAVELEPDSGRAWANLGSALAAHARQDTDLEAVRAYETAAELIRITPDQIGRASCRERV
jgi:tetratricopeptide (TPR) repeat protein